jgi:hypothetical protein
MANSTLCSAVAKAGGRAAEQPSCARTAVAICTRLSASCSPRWSSRRARDSWRRCGVRSASPIQNGYRPRREPRQMRPRRQPVHVGGAAAPDAELEHDQSALFPRNCRFHNLSGTQAGAQARADDLTSALASCGDHHVVAVDTATAGMRMRTAGLHIQAIAGRYDTRRVSSDDTILT